MAYTVNFRVKPDWPWNSGLNEPLRTNSRAEVCAAIKEFMNSAVADCQSVAHVVNRKTKKEEWYSDYGYPKK